MAATIAVVDDERDLRDSIVEYLQDCGFETIGAADALSFRALVAERRIDVVILDVAMPGEDGLSLARWLRRAGIPLGIIFATAAGTSVDRIIGLELGADDYVVKPYDLRELLARIRSVLRRMDGPPAAPAAGLASRPPVAGRRLAFGGFELDLDGRQLLAAGGRAVDLTPLEYDLLEILATRPNRVLSRALIAELGRADAGLGPDDRRIDIRITRLRKKIEPEPDRPRFIRTVRGEGYVFVPEGRQGG
ncbi:response regulator transcription factor [Xanthobacter sp. V4C-4]|uniref:response regulator n=1 Tax=Xanthobacter cornucopiae TaxID=3119924 RepID=UPI00372B72B5